MSGILNILAAIKGVAATVTDAYFNLVTLLLNTGTTNGAQNNTFLDSSSNNFTITRNGNTTQGTFTPFSQTGWSNFFNGSNDLLKTPNNANFNFGTNDFTVEFFFYAIAPVNNARFISTAPYTGTGIDIVWESSLSRISWYISSTAYTITLPSTNAWHHVAFTKSGTTLRTYIDGAIANTYTSFTTSITSANQLCIASLYDGASNLFNGYISNVRIINGTPLYTNSTYTVPTSALTPVTNTVLLTCQSNSFIDTNTQVAAKPITVTGTPSVQAFSPFPPLAAYTPYNVGGSGYFDGTGDYLSLVYSSQLQFTGDFTIEFWAYPLTQLNTAAGVVNNYSSWPSSTGFAIFCGHPSASSTKWAVALFGTFPAITSTNDFIKNAWSHVALVRSGTGTNNITLYVNGVASGTATSNNTVTGTANNWWIGTTGDLPSSQTFTGYLSGFRAINSAAYIGNFTPPTAPANPTGSNLCLNFTNAGIYDAASKNVLETVGNAQVSTTQAKFGTTSMYFDGTGDALAIPTPQKENIRFGTGNFTIEFWAWKSANGSAGYDTVISAATSGNASGGFILELSSSRGFGLAYDATFPISSNFNPNDSTWHHYAIVRNGSTFALYKDGTQLTTATLTPTLGVNGDAFIGAAVNSSTVNFNGYIDDLRVSKFARYTANFTAPTASFPIQ